MFTPSDLEQISRRGMTSETVGNQVRHFEKGFPFISLLRPALPGDGILALDGERRILLRDIFNNCSKGSSICKFVPASGAASRMFKHLFEFNEKYIKGSEGDSLFEKDHGFGSVWYFISHLRKIAFFDELSLRLERNGFTVDLLLQNKDYNIIIDYVLGESGLDYANLPKGLIKFHDYSSGARTSTEEHMVESGLYCKGSDGKANLHFTISPEHRSRFESLETSVKSAYEKMLGTPIEISYSVQSPATDTLAVDEENLPFRNPDGTLLFRPGGHGALLQNLSEIGEDIVFIKNIDNVVPDRLKDETVLYKKVIGGLLFSIRERIFDFLRRTENTLPGDTDLQSLMDFCETELNIKIPENIRQSDSTGKLQWLRNTLNRPVRVCGMVKNEGEPGGGPYWVRGKDGSESLQIVESSQVNLKDALQLEVFRSATHFNPVDLVCSIKDYKGNKFDLSRYIDEETGFISVKSSGGRTLKALERPGLWNGAMAGWITLFVEVPIITFNPVKTVNDLLRKEHLV
jgi:hypothetical protein